MPGSDFGSAVDDAVGAAVSDGLFGEEPFVAVEIAVDGIGGFAGEIGHHFVEAIAESEHMLCFDAEVGGWALEDAADEGLVEHDL